VQHFKGAQRSASAAQQFTKPVQHRRLVQRNKEAEDGCYGEQQHCTIACGRRRHDRSGLKMYCSNIPLRAE